MLGEVSGIRWHWVLRNVGHDSDGRKRTHLGTMLLILRVRVENGLHLRKLDNDCPENTGLGFAECDEATGTVPLVARRRASRRRRPLPFPADCSHLGVEVTFNYAEVEAVAAPNGSAVRT